MTILSALDSLFTRAYTMAFHGRPDDGRVPEPEQEQRLVEPRAFSHQSVYWQAVARGLARGAKASRRPALPIELIGPICKLAGFAKPAAVPFAWEQPPIAINISSHGPLVRDIAKMELTHAGTSKVGSDGSSVS